MCLLSTVLVALCCVAFAKTVLRSRKCADWFFVYIYVFVWRVLWPWTTTTLRVEQRAGIGLCWFSSIAARLCWFGL